MKAKELFKIIAESDDKIIAFGDAVKGLVLEVEDIIKVRNVKSDHAVQSIFKEQELKYKALVRLYNNANFQSEDGTYDFVAKDEGFREYIKAKSPSMYLAIWGTDIKLDVHDTNVGTKK